MRRSSRVAQRAKGRERHEGCRHAEHQYDGVRRRDDVRPVVERGVRGENAREERAAAQYVLELESRWAVCEADEGQHEVSHDAACARREMHARNQERFQDAIDTDLYR
mgnify:CR=1 FL=1